MSSQKSTPTTRDKVLTGVGIALCVILIPILLINCVLLVQGWVNEDEVPSIFNISPMIVLTNSMSGDKPDSFDGGALIFVKDVAPEKIKEGDVISFFDPAGNGSSVTTHRVIEIINEDGKISFITKGDNNNTEDEPVPAENLVGVYLMHIPGAGKIAMFMQSTPGLIICVVLPIVLLVGYDVVRRRVYEKSKKSDTDALLAELEALRAAKAEAEKNQPSDDTSENTPPES